MNVYNFEQTFKYLGAVITADNNMQEEIKQRTTQENKCTFAVQTLLKSKFITREAKTGIYQTMIRPGATYASEIWTLTVRDTELLRRFERNILRMIYGQTLKPTIIR